MVIAVAAVIAFGLALPNDMGFLAGIFAFGAMLTFAIAHMSVIALRFREAGRPSAFRLPLSFRFRKGTVPLPAVLGALFAVAAWLSIIVLHEGARVVGGVAGRDGVRAAYDAVARSYAGERDFDVNIDGVAHYGLHADWFRDLANLGGRKFARDLFRGAEAYLQTWERAVGVPGPRCLPAPRRFSHRGLGRVKIGMPAVRVLRRAGQPGRRVSRSYRWCVDVKRKDPGARAAAVFTRRGRVGLVASTARGHRIRGLGPNRPAGHVLRNFQSLGNGLYVRRRANGLPTRVYGVRKGRISFTGLAAPRIAGTRKRLEHYLRLGNILKG
jgi:hypothetical protein